MPVHFASILTVRRRSLAAAVLAFAFAVPAHAVNKETVQIETQIQQLQDAVARLQQSNDERMGVLKDLVQQSADSVNKMSVTMDGLQRQMRTQQDGTNAKVDQLGGQTQALNDSIDEIKARLNRLDKTLADIQNQQQSINAGLQNLAPTGTPSPVTTPGPIASAPVTPPPAVAPLTAKTTPTPAPGKPPAAVPLITPTPANAPSASDLYKTALSDYMAAKYTLASTEFGEVIKTYPDNSLAGNAFYYQGEIDYRNGKFANAVKNYDHLLEQFPDSAKTPVSHLHKGQALLVLKQNDAGIREFRTLIARFPASPEAAQAKSRLNGLGVAVGGAKR